MRNELISQLDEFLEKGVCFSSLLFDIHNLSIGVECIPFIDTLFTVLRTKSYLPYGQTSPASPMDTGIPIPLDALLSPNDRSRKRSIDNDERDGRPPTKAPRLSADGTFSRYNGRNDTTESRSTGGWGQHQNGRQSQPYRPPDIKRGICRDYHSPYPLSLTRATTLNIFFQTMATVPAELTASTVMATMQSFPVSSSPRQPRHQLLSLFCPCSLTLQFPLPSQVDQDLLTTPTKHKWTCAQVRLQQGACHLVHPYYSGCRDRII
jgi:hypothetical protein